MKAISSLRAALLGLSVLGMGLPAMADQLADVQAAGKIVTSTDMFYAPFDMIVDGVYQGMTKDLFDGVTEQLGVEPVYQDIPWTAQLPGLDAGRFDIVIAPVVVRADRAERYAYSIPIADAAVALIKRTGNDALTKPEDIKGLKVGAQQGTDQFMRTEEFAESIGGAEVKEYGTMDEAYADLAAGRLDAVAGSLPLLANAAKTRPEVFQLFDEPKFGPPTYYAWVLRKGEDSASLVEAVNDALLTMTDDGRVEAIQKEWLGEYIELPRVVPLD